MNSQLFTHSLPQSPKSIAKQHVIPNLDSGNSNISSLYCTDIDQYCLQLRVGRLGRFAKTDLAVPRVTGRQLCASNGERPTTKPDVTTAVDATRAE